VKTILIFVSTLDGKITKWGDPHIRSWSSKNDQDHFDLIWNDTRIIVMGNNTYKPDPVKPSTKHLFVVLTRQPAKYRRKEIPGQLEFTDESPAQLVSRFEKEGEEKMLIVGGAQIATSFLRAQLIDELWLTIEPKIFGQGSNFVIEEKLDINLKLVSCTRVNNLGTLVTKYMVERTREI